MTTLNLRYCEILHDSVYYDVMVAVSDTDELDDILQDWALSDYGPGEALTLPDDLIKSQNASDVFTSKDIGVNVYIKGSAYGSIDAARMAGIAGTFPTMPTTLVSSKYVMPACSAYLWTTTDYQGVFTKYSIASASLDLVADSMNYIGIKYNAGSPTYVVYANQSYFDYATIIPVGAVLYWGTEIIPIPYGQKGDGLAERLFKNQRSRKQFDITSDFTLTSSNLNVSLAALTVNAGFEDFSLSSVDTSATDKLYLFYLDATSAWQSADASGVLNNTQYQGDGTGLQNLDAGKFVVQYIYRLVDENSEQIFTVLSGSFDSLAEAKDSDMIITLPDEISKACVLVGRAITEKSASDTVIQKIQRVAPFATVS